MAPRALSVGRLKWPILNAALDSCVVANVTFPAGLERSS